MRYSDEQILEMGTKCLMDGLGVIDAERYLMMVRRPGGNYTEERKAIYDNMTEEEILQGVREFMLEHPVEELFAGRVIVYGEPPRRETPEDEP
ncbi:MAG: hypothetical protein IJ026_02115 [Candidatus Methanomethylophilaceae archaeon]|nr:hypothetical protein [Candidatus Methanomethylophilaceae archaeon]